MASTPTIVLISDDPADQLFFSKLAQAQNWAFAQIFRADQLESTLIAFSDRVVIWNLDFASRMDRDEHQGVMTILSISIPSHRLFALSKNPINKYTRILTAGPRIDQHIYQIFHKAGFLMLSRLFLASFEDMPTDLRLYFKDPKPGQKITLKKSTQRRAAVEAIENYFIKAGLTPRLAAKVSTACDELLLNAIFHAPHDEKGRPLRKTLPKNTPMEFSKRETVDLSVISTDSYIGVSVTDHFGMFNRQSAKNGHFLFEEATDSKELGLKRVISLGLSLMILCRPKVRTDAMIFFPICKTHKEFQNMFRFSVLYQARLGRG